MGSIESVRGVMCARRRQPDEVAYGLALGHERFSPRELVEQAVEAHISAADPLGMIRTYGEHVLPRLRES